MRQKLILALILVITSLISCTLFFVFLNVEIPQEPFSSWSELPYAGMFQYAGIICLAGAIIYLLMELFENVFVNIRNLFIISVVVLANFISFFIGGYHTLLPFFFLVGLIGTSVFGAWVANGVGTMDLVIFIVIATIVAAIDEFAHTSVGTLTYFDNGVPSLLTVFGWSLFMMLLVTLTKFLMRFRIFDVKDQRMLRVSPVIVSLILVSIAALVQGYFTSFDWVLFLVYVLLGFASLYYTYRNPLKWNILLMITSLIFGFIMEFMGRWEGLWTFRFMEPVSLLILFSWPLRLWTVNALSLLLNVDLSGEAR